MLATWGACAPCWVRDSVGIGVGLGALLGMVVESCLHCAALAQVLL